MPKPRRKGQNSAYSLGRKRRRQKGKKQQYRGTHNTDVFRSRVKDYKDQKRNREEGEDIE